MYLRAWLHQQDSSQIDGHFDPYLLENHLTDPQGLGKKVIEDVLEKSDSPYFVVTRKNSHS